MPELLRSQMRLYELYALSHPLFAQAPETVKRFERPRHPNKVLCDYQGPRPCLMALETCELHFMTSWFVQGLNGGNYQVTSTVDSLQLRTRAGLQPVLFEVGSASISLICTEM